MPTNHTKRSVTGSQDVYRAGNAASECKIVFLPGLFAGDWMWNSAIDLVCKIGFEAIVFREPFARVRPPRKNPIQIYHEIVLEQTEGHDQDRLWFCGNSLGGLIALDLAMAGRGRVLASGVPGIGKAYLPGLNVQKLPTRDDMRQAAKTIFHDHSCITEAMIEDAATCFSTREYLSNIVIYLVAIRNYDVASVVRSLAHRSIFVWGEYDAITPLSAWLEEFRTEIAAQRIRFAVVKGSGHSPMIEQPWAFNEVLQSSLLTLPAVIETH
jgi:2-hydroxy-6-oxonona-2,4-dienedioate hydrolase